MKLIAFPNHLPSTPAPKSRRPKSRAITTPNPVQIVFDALRIRNPSLSVEVFHQFLIAMGDETVTTQVKKLMRIEKKEGRRCCC